MKLAFYGHFYPEKTAAILKQVFAIFSTNEHSFCFEEKFASHFQNEDWFPASATFFGSAQNLPSDTHFMISIGGDGTLLRAAAYVKNKNIPIVGINAGRLGFLANVQQEAVATTLLHLKNNDFTISKRSLLQVNCTPNNCIFEEGNNALNEITVARKDTTSMITIETWVNNQFLTSYWADGLIVSTPTGSTGYSLSCGGPVITPEVKCWVITPIAPHNLSVRPLVIADDTEIRLKVYGRESHFLVSCDSETQTVAIENEILIKKSPHIVQLVEFPDEKFIKTLRNKMLWGEDKRN